MAAIYRSMAAIYRSIWELLRSPLEIGVAIAGNFLVIQGSVFFGIIDPVAAQNIVTDGTLGTPAGAVPITPNGTLKVNGVANLDVSRFLAVAVEVLCLP